MAARRSGWLAAAVILVVFLAIWFTGAWAWMVSVPSASTAPIDLPPGASPINLSAELMTPAGHKTATDMLTNSVQVHGTRTVYALQGVVTLSRTRIYDISQKAALFIWTISDTPLPNPLPNYTYPSGATIVYTHVLDTWGPTTSATIAVSLNMTINDGQYLSVIIDTTALSDAEAQVQAYVS